MMSNTLLLFFIGVIFESTLKIAEAHGHLSLPTVRDYAKTQDLKNAPVAFPLDKEFVCRNLPALSPSQYKTVTAGQTVDMTWGMEAPHPGDCFAYISYDVNKEDTQMKWFKIAQWNDCERLNLQAMKVTIPSYLPSCEHCVLRWEWYALHLRDINIVEFYSQCADIKIIGSSSNNQLPTPQVTIPGHLPMDAQHYRSEFKQPDLIKFTGPPIATIGGSAYSCVSSYDQSCNVAPVTNNPCVISTQRCVTANTYQACGVGETTTVWGAEQSCQAGLVCAPHADGIHIMCTFPSSVPPPQPKPLTTGKTALIPSSSSSSTSTSTSSPSSSLSTGSPGNTGTNTGIDSSALCYKPGTPNLGGKIRKNPPVCGARGKNNRCSEGQCCSKFGYCGPIKESDGLYYDYVNGKPKQVSLIEAYNLYCNNTVGDYRKYTCASLGLSLIDKQQQNSEEEAMTYETDDESNDETSDENQSNSSNQLNLFQFSYYLIICISYALIHLH